MRPRGGGVYPSEGSDNRRETFAADPLAREKLIGGEKAYESESLGHTGEPGRLLAET